MVTLPASAPSSRSIPKARDVTRERLYLETIERVLGKVGKVVVDASVGDRTLPVLPINELTRSVTAATQSQTTPAAQPQTQPAPGAQPQQAPLPGHQAGRQADRGSEALARRQTMLKWFGLLLIPIVLVVISQMFFIVDEKDQVIVTQVGQYLYSVREPGIYPKTPFLQSATHFDKRILVSDPTPAEYLSLDQKRLVADPVTRWRIVDPLLFYTSVREEAGALARLDDIVFSEMRAEVANFEFTKVISTERESIMARVSRADSRAGQGLRHRGRRRSAQACRSARAGPGQRVCTYASRAVAHSCSLSFRGCRVGGEDPRRCRSRPDRHPGAGVRGEPEAARRRRGRGNHHLRPELWAGP